MSRDEASQMLVITVPLLPPKEYSPNARVHWAERKRAGDAYRDAVYFEAVNRRNLFDKGKNIETRWKALEYADIGIALIFAEERIRDEDNHRARFKPGMDALMMAGIIRHDDMKHITSRVVCATDEARAPLTIITVVNQITR